MPELQNRILTELQVLHTCKSEYIIGFFGSFFHAGRVCICTELMDLGSLERIGKLYGKLFHSLINFLKSFNWKKKKN